MSATPVRPHRQLFGRKPYVSADRRYTERKGQAFAVIETLTVAGHTLSPHEASSPHEVKGFG